MNIIETEVDVLVIGGGTAGPMAAVKAKQANPALRVLLLEKAHASAAARSPWAWTGSTTPCCPATPRPSSTCARSPSPTTASSTRRR